MAERIPLDLRVTAAAAGAWVVAPTGDIAYHEAPAFRAGIKEALDKRPTRLVADLTGVAYMGTPGVATLVEALKLTKQAGVPLFICGMNDRVRAVFEIARLHTVFKIVPDVAAALSA
jgi:anti-anti-sigma factor